MKEKLQEIYEGLTERLKSPFILTFLVVWSVHHWRFLFYLLTFDENFKQGSKFRFANYYIVREGFTGMVLVPLGYTILSFLAYVVLSLLFETITEGYERWGRPFIYFWLNKNKIVNRKEHEKVVADLKSLTANYEDLDRKYDDLADAYDSVKGESEGKDEKIEGLENDNTVLKRDLEVYRDKTKREDDFIYNRTRLAMFQLIQFYEKKFENKKIIMQIQSLFLGKWTRSEFNSDFDPGQRDSEKELNFKGENVTDIRDEFILNVISVEKLEKKEIYFYTYRTASNVIVHETLFKVLNDLFMGKLEDTEVDTRIAEKYNPFKVVEYRKV